jgi:class 3 adenylate cyclase
MDKNLKSILINVFNNEVEQINVDQILIENQIPKGLKVLNLAATILCVDIRKSTKLTTKLGMKNITKVYHMFSKISAKAVYENGGKIIQFAGDGFLAAFNNWNKNNSGLNAFNAAKNIALYLKDTYKQILPSDFHFDCGYGISTGHIYMTRLKQKQYKLQSFGIFPGDATNFASKICDIANEREIILDEKSYKMNHIPNAIKDEYKGKEIWRCQLV